MDGAVSASSALDQWHGLVWDGAHVHADSAVKSVTLSSHTSSFWGFSHHYKPLKMHQSFVHWLQGSAVICTPFKFHFKLNGSSIGVTWGKISFLPKQDFTSIRLIGVLEHFLIITTNICRLPSDEHSSHPIVLNHLGAA